MYAWKYTYRAYSASRCSQTQTLKSTCKLEIYLYLTYSVLQPYYKGDY
jgi:hypothetical protein